MALQLKIDNELNTALKDMATDKESLAQAEEELEGLAEKALGARIIALGVILDTALELQTK